VLEVVSVLFVERERGEASDMRERFLFVFLLELQGTAAHLMDTHGRPTRQMARRTHGRAFEGGGAGIARSHGRLAGQLSVGLFLPLA
jgi:hypothetical protein